MVYDFKTWMSESNMSKLYIDTCTDIMILYCLRALAPNGGNNAQAPEYWRARSEVFSGDGPDFWVNCDFSDNIAKEVRIVIDNYDNEIENKFIKYGIEISASDPDEVIVSILDQKSESLVKFYTAKPGIIEELSKKLHIPLLSKDYGI